MTNPINPIDALVREFVEDYEMIGETEDGRDACHTPTEDEQALIEDALHGFLADDRYTALLAQMQQPSDEREAQPVEQRAWDVELDEWVRATGAIPHGGSWHFELLSMLEEAAASSARALGPVKAQQEPAVLPETMSRDEMLAYYSNYANLCAHEALRYQKRIRDLEAKLAAHQGAQPAVPEGMRLVPVCEIQKGHLTHPPKEQPWCKEILVYSPGNPGDNPDRRMTVYVLAAAPSASAQLQPTARCTAIRCTCKPSQMLTCDRMIDVAQEPQGEAQQPDSSAIRALKLGQPQQPNADSGHLVVGVGDGSYNACASHGLAHPCEMCAYEKDIAPLESALAECRDLFPVPEPGQPTETEWLEAMSFPASVPAFIRACLSAGRVVGADSGPHGKNHPESVSESVSIPSTLSLKEADTSKRDSKESGNA